MQPLRILILFYSFTGATAKLADCVAAGAAMQSDVQVLVKRVPELVPDAVFAQKPHLKAVKEDLARRYPEATIQDLLDCDAVAFGTPVHFGSFASQLKQFLDQLSPVWLEGHLVDKPAAVFCTAATLHGGEEATLISLMIPLLNLGMLPIGLPYASSGETATFDSASPYGAVFVSGKDGKAELTHDSRRSAELLGQRLATLAQRLAK